MWASHHAHATRKAETVPHRTSAQRSGRRAICSSGPEGHQKPPLVAGVLGRVGRQVANRIKRFREPRRNLDRFADGAAEDLASLARAAQCAAQNLVASIDDTPAVHFEPASASHPLSMCLSSVSLRRPNVTLNREGRMPESRRAAVRSRSLDYRDAAGWVAAEGIRRARCAWRSETWQMSQSSPPTLGSRLSAAASAGARRAVARA